MPVTFVTLLASIPSPSSGVLDIGIEIRAYGVMIGLGVLAAVWLFAKRLPERGMSEEHAANIAMWAVPAGLVGARLYHVITDWRSFQGRWIEAFYIWQGGLGILGVGIYAAFKPILPFHPLALLQPPWPHHTFGQ